MKNKSIILATLLLAAPTLKSCGPSFFAEATIYDSYTKQKKIDTKQKKIDVKQGSKEVEIFCGNYRKEVDCKPASDKSNEKTD